MFAFAEPFHFLALVLAERHRGAFRQFDNNPAVVNPGDTKYEQFLNVFNRNEDYDIDFLIRNKL